MFHLENTPENREYVEKFMDIIDDYRLGHITLEELEEELSEL